MLANLRNKDKLLFDTGILTLVFILLYTWDMIINSLSLSSILYIIVNTIYFPIIFIWKRKYFCLYHVIYALVLVVTIILKKTLLYNNFTAYFIILSIAVIKPKWKFTILGCYFTIATIAFMVNDQHMVKFLIHISRCLYYYTIFNYFIFTKFKESSNGLKFLELKDDEINILSQMVAGRKQKEIEDYSINTVTKKLQAARTRNKLETTQELLVHFIEEHKFFTEKNEL